MVEKNIKEGTCQSIQQDGEEEELPLADAPVVIKKVIALAGKAFIIKAQQRAGSH